MRRIKSWLKSINREQRGFSLLEVIVAMLILSIIVASTFNALSAMTRSTLDVNTVQSGGNLAASLMEQAKRVEYASPPYYNPPDSPTTYSPDPTLLAHFPDFSAEIGVEPVPQALRDNLIQKITVTVWCGDQLVTTLEGYKTKR